MLKTNQHNSVILKHTTKKTQLLFQSAVTHQRISSHINPIKITHPHNWAKALRPIRARLLGCLTTVWQISLPAGSEGGGGVVADKRYSSIMRHNYAVDLHSSRFIRHNGNVNRWSRIGDVSHRSRAIANLCVNGLLFKMPD